MIRLLWIVPALATAALLGGVAGLPAPAFDAQAQLSLRPTATAFLAGHEWAATATPLRQLAACQPDGASCKVDADCCSNACKPIAEGRACVSNK